MQPTGSSILILSKNRTESTTSTPATSPMTSELGTLTKAHGAVIATRPARAPLRIIVRSGLPNRSQAVIDAAIAAVAAAVLVATAIRPIAPASAAIVLPGLKPNQPNHSTKTPSVANAMLWPGSGSTLPSLLYLPMRGPSAMAPANAAQPPTECTTVEPAKSNMPSFAAQPPP